MTLDDQLRALAPLTPALVVTLAGGGFATPSAEVWQLRRRGRCLSDQRLRMLAGRLRELADKAEGLICDDADCCPADRAPAHDKGLAGI